MNSSMAIFFRRTLFFLGVCAMLLPAHSFAQASAPAAAAGSSSSTCTNFAQRAAAVNAGGAQTGMIGDIYIYLTKIVGTASQRLFTSFTSNPMYTDAIYASFALMILFFGVGFTMGLVQATFQEVLIRLLKMGLVATIISPGGWVFFNDTVVQFFNQGTNDLILGVIAIGTGMPNPPDATPFYQLDQIASFMIHPETLIAIMAGTINGGPFGVVMSALMGFAMMGFIGLVIDALRMYAVTFVARAMLLGIAPIFVVFLLFQKTAALFSAWVNALVSTSLQPILMFTFLSFFLMMIGDAATNMMSADLCWTQIAAPTSGAINQPSFWAFRDPATGDLITSTQTWNGALQCIMQQRGTCQEFPINIINVLTFLILVYIAKEFSKVIQQTANELAGTNIHISGEGKFEAMLKQSQASKPANPIQVKGPSR